MNISLISVDSQETPKNENVQKSVSSVKNSNDDDEIASLLSFDTPSTLQSMNIESPSYTFIIKKPCIKRETSRLMVASKSNPSDTPHRRFIKHGIRALTDKLAIKDLKLKTVRQTVRRQQKKIATMTEIIKKLPKENLINEDVYLFLF